MADSGRDPHREARRAGENASRGEYILGADGKPMRDRYGRPIRRRVQDARHTRPPRRAAQPEQTRFDIGRYQQRQRPPRQEQAPAQPTSQPRYQMPAPERAKPQPQPRPQQRPPQPVHPQPQPQPRPQPQRQYQPPVSEAPRRRRKKARSLKATLGCFGWALAIFLVISLVFVLWSDSKLTRVEALPEEQVADTAGTNWLLVGSDSRQGLSEEDQMALGTGGDVGVGRTDTIMLLHIPRSGKAKLVSLPRDSYVNVPGFGEDKINSAFTYGGPQLLTQTVEEATGLKIDHYAEVGMGGLANIVDSAGGVEMCLDEPISDPLASIDLPAGCQKLEGPQALGLVRTRATALGDLDRVERQREFFSALLDEITSPSTLLNPFRMLSLVNHTASSFVVDKGDHVWHLARVALAMGSGVELETAPLGGFADTAVGNVVLWDDAEAEALFGSMR